jgi:mono/diheme cytochrome c family protein
MKSKSIPILAVAALSMALSGSGFAAGAEKRDLGKQEYESKCAVCHGVTGKGDGGAIDVLNRTPSDLTVLSKKNGGVFPYDRLYSVIDGREMLKGHGVRDMPIWGRDYSTEGARAGEYYFDAPFNMDMYARARILSLLDYLNRIQVK